jgi:tetratricopeptide (TPR) repeat protein
MQRREVPMSTGQPGTRPDAPSGLSDKDQWLQDALGIDVAGFGSSADTESQRPQGQQAKAQAKVDAGEPTVTPRRTRITAITVAGRKLDLWGLMDKDGAIAQSGGKPPLGLLTSINRAAVELYKTNDTALLVRVPLWRQAVADVRRTAAAAAGELKQAEAQKAGIAKQRDQGGGFFEDVNGYLKALAEVKTLAGAIQSAQTAYEQSLAELESKVGLKDFEEGKDDVAKKQGELDAKKAELAEAQEIFGKVLEIGKKVASADWKGLADQAIGYIKDKAEEAVRDKILGQLFDVDIKRLTDALDEAKKKTAAAKAKWLEKSVEAATLGMRKAATDFDNARAELKAALANLARNQGNAVGALKRNESTRRLGQIIEQRSGQIAAIGKAREVVHSFMHVAGSVVGQAGSLRQQYARLSTEIGHLKDDPVYRSDSAWGKEALAVAVIDADLMVRVADAAGGLQGEANVALTYLGNDAEAGPMGPYNKAIETVDKALQA